MNTIRHERKYVILAVLCLSVFLVVVDNTIVNVALPSLSKSLGASNSALQWVVDGYSLPFAGLLLAGGGLSDRWGRKRTMQLGLFFFGIFSLFAAFSTTTGQLITSRALMGVAAAFIFPATLSILTVTFEDANERARALGIWSATSGLAVAFGPITGGALITHFWYGSVFLINVPLVAITLVAGYLWIPESRNPFQRSLDPVGLALGTAGITTLVLAIIEGPSWGWRSATTLGLFALSLVLLVSFTRYELRREGPLLDVRVFKIPAFSAGSGAIAMAFFGLFGFIFLMTQYFQLVRGYSALSAGVHTLPFAITTAVLTPIGAVLALRIGARYVVSAGLLIMGLGLFWVSLQSDHAAYWGPIIYSMIVLAVGFSLITAPSTAAIMGSLSPSQIGAGSAVNNVTRELGGTMGVAIIGSVFSSLFGPQIIEAFRGVPLSASQLATAQSSMQAALGTVAHLPSQLQPTVLAGVTQAFMSGFHRGCLVAAILLALTGLVTFAFLPGKKETDKEFSMMQALAH